MAYTSPRDALPVRVSWTPATGRFAITQPFDATADNHLPDEPAESLFRIPAETPLTTSKPLWARMLIARGPRFQRVALLHESRTAPDGEAQTRSWRAVVALERVP